MSTDLTWVVVRTHQHVAAALDVGLARHEDQDVARRVREVNRHRLLHRRLDEVLLRRLREELRAR